MLLGLLVLTGSGLGGCQNHKTEIMLDGQDSEERQDDSGKDAAQKTEEASAEISEVPEMTEPAEIFIDICGAVVNPGVYKMEADSRVFQVVEAAGGFLPEAAAASVNQAEPVSDGQQIYVPTQEEIEEGISPAAIQPEENSAESADGVVNINTADANALKSLSGIGDAKAQAILAYREEHGSFSSIEDIMQVPGIKESTFSAIKDKIAVK